MDEVQIVLALAVIYFIYRWTSRSTTSSSSASSAAGGADQAERYNTLAGTIPQGEFEQAVSLFPHFTERELRWHFVRTGRLRPLETIAQELLEMTDASPARQLSLARNRTPPAGFMPSQTETASNDSPNSQAKSPTVAKSRYPSLIQRLNLQQEAAQQDAQFQQSTSSTDVKGKGREMPLGQGHGLDDTGNRQTPWAELSLQERKARMVLDARRRFLERDRKTSL